jgi:hypothetical protein
MMLLAFAALLQAAQSGPAAGPAAPAAVAPPLTTPSEAAGPAVPAWRAAGRAWSDCAKGRIDARLQSSDTPEAMADAAIAGCAGEMEAVRSAIATERGPEVAAANVERVRTSGRAMFLAYIASRRGRGAAPAATPAGPGR